MPQCPDAVTPADSSPSRGSTASAVSFDRGFLAEISVRDRFEFQSQQRQHEAEQVQTRTEVRDESQGVYELERQLERWVGQCPLCVIKGVGQEVRHSISECRQEGAGGTRADWIEMVKGMRPGNGKAGKFVAYSCCFTCYAPQAICQGWEHKEGQSGKWKATGKECQFKDIIMPVVVCMLCEDDWARAEFTNWATEGGINTKDPEEVMRWLGQKIIWGGIEVSRLVQLFYRLEKGRELRQGVVS
jgi:hypothetical protein